MLVLGGFGVFTAWKQITYNDLGKNHWFEGSKFITITDETHSRLAWNNFKLNSIKYEYSCSVAIFIVRHKIKQNQKKKRRYTRICPLWRSVLFDIKNTTTVRRWWWFFLRFCFEMKWQEQKIIPLLRKNLYIRRIWLNDAFIYFQNQIKCKSKDYHILKNLNIQQGTQFEYWNS